MSSLKDRMAAFQAASSPDAFEKQNKKKNALDEIKAAKGQPEDSASTPAPAPAATPVKKKSTTPAATPSNSATTPTPVKKTPGKVGGAKSFTPTASNDTSSSTPVLKKTPGKIGGVKSFTPTASSDTSSTPVVKKTPGKISGAKSFVPTTPSDTSSSSSTPVVKKTPGKIGGAKSFVPTTPSDTSSSSSTPVVKKTPGKIGGAKSFVPTTPSDTSSSSTPVVKKTPGKIGGVKSFTPTTPSDTGNSASTPVLKKTPGKIGGQKTFTPTTIETPTLKKAPTPTKLTPAQMAPVTTAFEKPANLTHTTTKTPMKLGKVVANKETPNKDAPKDWDYLYELAQYFDLFKAHEAHEKKVEATKTPPKAAASANDIKNDESSPGVKKDIRAALEGTLGGNYTAKADWLNDQWITDHLTEDKEFQTLTFKLGDPKLFSRFDKTDEKNRDAVIDKFVNTLLGHPKAKDITGLDLSNCLLPDEFLEDLCKKVLENPKKGLPKLRLLNLETNVIMGPGIEAIAQVIRNEDAWRYLQVLMLENQKKPHNSDAEEALADAIVFSQSIVVCSFRIRGGLQRQQVNNTIATNIDNLRLARREHAAKTGTLKARKRNEMEQYFDKIAANDPSITAVDLVGDTKFLSLNSEEKTKSGSVFANNTHVKTVKMVKLQLDDTFAQELGQALASNNTIEQVLIDSNAISGTGIQAIFAGLAQNSSVTELQVRHQSKTMSSADEEPLGDILEPNNTIIKLGVDTRNQLVKMKLDRKTNANREYQRKMRAQAKKG